MIVSAHDNPVMEPDFLSALLAVVQDGICLLSPELDLILQNPAMQYWYGAGDAPLQGKCYQLYHKRSTPCENCPALRAMASGAIETEEVLFEKDGRKEGWQQVSCMAVRGSRNEIKWIVEYIRDNTDERKAALSSELIAAQNENLTQLLREQETETRKAEQKRAEKLNQSFSVMLRYLEKVLDDDSYALIQRQMEWTKNAIVGETSPELLSGQELAIARLIADGLMSKEIADRLHVSKKTVDYHRSALRKKLNLTGSSDLRQAILTYFEKSGRSPLS